MLASNAPALLVTAPRRHATPYRRLSPPRPATRDGSPCCIVGMWDVSLTRKPSPTVSPCWDARDPLTAMSLRPYIATTRREVRGRPPPSNRASYRSIPIAARPTRL
jgi:hypothetical protein